MAEDSISVRRALAEALESGDVDAVFVHRETRVPEEVVEAAVEQGMPVHLVGDEEATGVPVADKPLDVELRTAEDVTPEIVEMVQSIVEGFYNERPIDWTDVLERLERQTLDDGRGLDLGEDWLSPAIKKIKREVRAWRKLG